ncbi:MAG: VWA domain-containing protein [gamma proteobacterium symbiont of Bathyaustriella thionipta]|nr:VWA domain-containing protein [gamma proteobacterium symbiont of Bathyaustriella thionipta]
MNLTWLRPEWWLAVIPLAIVIFLLWRHNSSTNRWQKVCDQSLLPYITTGYNGRTGQHWKRPLMIALPALLMITALAGPALEKPTRQLYTDQSALVILLDLSRSMNAADIKPSRLQRARFKITDLLRQRPDGQTALVTFAAEPFVVTPLTTDTATIESLLPSLNTRIMPAQGSRPDRAVREGIKLLQQAGMAQGRILLLTDGMNTEAADNIGERMDASPYQLDIIGIGTAQGAPIPDRAGYLKQSDGNMIIARLDESTLQQAARAAHGHYQLMSSSNRDIQTVLSRMTANTPSKDDSERQAVVWSDIGYWLLLPALLFSLLLFRQPGLMALAILISLPMRPALAYEWQDLWATPDQQGAKLMQQNQAAAAQARFQNPDWKAAAAYQAGDYASTLKTLDKPDNADDWYNKGNAYARQNAYKEALAAYENALKQNPADEDAQYNKKLIEDLLEQQKKQQQKQQQQQQQQQKESDKKDSSQQSDKKQEPSSANQSRQKDGQQGDQQKQDQKQSSNKKNQSSAKQGQQDSQQQKPSQDSQNSDSQQASSSDQSQNQSASDKQKEEKSKSSSSSSSEAEEIKKQPQKSAAGEQEKDKQKQQQDKAAMQQAMQAEQKQADKAEQQASAAKAAAAREPEAARQQNKQDANAAVMRPQADEEHSEAERWLREIPDDSGSFLQRKFRYQYRTRDTHPSETQTW